MELLEKIKAQTKKRRAAITEKVHPALVPMLRACGEALKAVKGLGENAPNELLEEIRSRMNAELQKVAQKYPQCPVSAMDLMHADVFEPEKPIDEGAAQAETFHFIRHLKPLSTDIDAAKNGDSEAHRRIYRTAQDLMTLQFAQGPLKPPKANLDHVDIFMMGWGMGLEKLGWEELAVFFDENCSCGKTHDPNALRKQAKRLRESLGVK